VCVTRHLRKGTSPSLGGSSLMLLWVEYKKTYVLWAGKGSRVAALLRIEDLG